tara:strand:+ start:420 stop:1688 length:1269 start_codon:yes stop_codon:yes gene_type:complete
MLRTKDVFTPGGQPEITYVSREHLGIENKLDKAIEKGYSIVAVTGATKSGKTVLCNNVLGGSPSVWVQGGQFSTEIEFWDQIAHKLELVNNRCETASKAVVDGSKFSAKAGVNLGANIGGATESTSSTSSQKAETRSYSTNTKLACLAALKAGNICLVIDDFHYVPKATQQLVVRGLKAEVFSGLSIIILAVPHRAFDAISVEKELEGRFRHVEMPNWSREDLSKIPELGNPALNVTCTTETIEGFAEEALGSPLLMQSFCSSMCINRGIKTAQEQLSDITPTYDETRTIYLEVAEDFGLPTYKLLWAGPQSRKPRIQRKTIDGQDVDKYQAILMAVARTGPLAEITYDQIKDAMRQILVGELPQKHEITQALAQMGKIAQRSSEISAQGLGEPAIEWDGEGDTLYVVDPYLRFYMKWGIPQ